MSSAWIPGGCETSRALIDKVGVLPLPGGMVRGGQSAIGRACEGHATFRGGIRFTLRPRSLSRRSPVQEAQALSSFLPHFPDYERGWIMPAIAAAIRQIRRHRIKWIMTSARRTPDT